MWLTDLAETVDYPTRPSCPNSKKQMGQPENVAAVGLSHLSHLSHSKTMDGKPNCESKPPAGHYVFPEPGQPRPWPVLWTLIERHNCTPLVLEKWPASVVLCFAPGVLVSEKQAALRYAVEHWQALLTDMALPTDGSVRHCWLEGYEYYCRPGNVQEVAACALS